jgi:hypothetical protein
MRHGVRQPSRLTFKQSSSRVGLKQLEGVFQNCSAAVVGIGLALGATLTWKSDDRNSCALGKGQREGVDREATV